MIINEFSRTFDRDDNLAFYFKIESLEGEYSCRICVSKKKIINASCNCKHGIYNNGKEVMETCRHLNKCIEVLSFLKEVNL